MNQQINAMQESIKIALDAADAATDVTSEYKKIKNEYMKAEQKVKEIHKYTTIVFSSSIATAVIAIILTGLLYFKSLSELEDMTCLLYTSPSPRDLLKSRMPSSA